MRVAFCGVRGSMPVSGEEFLRTGGRTSCVAVALEGQPYRLVLDAGTGLTNLTALLEDEPFQGHLLLGHLHWDHTQGIPFFAGGFAERADITVLIPEQGSPAVEVLARSFSPPHFPIRPDELGPQWRFDSLHEGPAKIGEFTLLALEIPHKGGRTFGFRIEGDGVAIAYLSDHRPTAAGPGPDGLGERHHAFMELARGVDLLIHDAQHLASEFPGLEYLGHSTVEYVIAAAEAAGVRQVALYHHDPRRVDDDIDLIEKHAQSLATGVKVFAAREGQVLEVLR